MAIIEPLPPESSGGRHHPEGVLLVAGPGIRQGAVLDGARLIDLAPTILYVLGLPIPSDMDGWVLVNLFEPEFAAAHPIRTGPAMGISELQPSPDAPCEEVSLIEERLRSLGYLE